jgi:hypothetical protein
MNPVKVLLAVHCRKKKGNSIIVRSVCYIESTALWSVESSAGFLSKIDKEKLLASHI